MKGRLSGRRRTRRWNRVSDGRGTSKGTGRIGSKAHGLFHAGDASELGEGFIGIFSGDKYLGPKLAR